MVWSLSGPPMHFSVFQACFLHIWKFLSSDLDSTGVYMCLLGIFQLLLTSLETAKVFPHIQLACWGSTRPTSKACKHAKRIAFLPQLSHENGWNSILSKIMEVWWRLAWMRTFSTRWQKNWRRPVIWRRPWILESWSMVDFSTSMHFVLWPRPLQQVCEVLKGRFSSALNNLQWKD